MPNESNRSDMPLVVEDGSGLLTANAFITRAYATAYWDARGYSYAGHDGSAIDKAIVRATQYLSESFRWQGIRVKDRNHYGGYQALAWPRYGVWDHEDGYVPDDSIPRELQQATAEAAFYELQNPNALQPAYEAHERARQLRAGPVGITYAVTDISAEGARPMLLLVRDLVGEFLSQESRSTLSSPAARG